MPSSWSTSLRFELQITGENINLWGDKLSNTLARVDDAVAGYVAVPLSGDYILQAANSNTTADEARRAHLKFTGALTLGATITLPAVSKSYWIWNASGKTLTFTTGSGSTVSVENGDILPLWCDGTNVKSTTYGGYNLKDYIASMTATAGAVPGTTGNLGKALKVTVDGGPPTWQQLQSADIGDFVAQVNARTLSLALALGGA
jgi:hypothetical protein